MCIVQRQRLGDVWVIDDNSQCACTENQKEVDLASILLELRPFFQDQIVTRLR